ncbi:hypothetical protein FACS1894199_15720 [Bacteroidia bacterium]|nr:hypothetical protein FACS1894199_15720 [Bacteroidia bacterium]
MIMEVMIKKYFVTLWLLCAGLLCAVVNVSAQVVTYNSTGAGLMSLTDVPATTTNLTVTGVIDARDVKFIRDNIPLVTLDLTDVTIVVYDGPDGPRSPYQTGSFFYPANELPASSFTLKGSLTSVSLPTSITSIGGSAFSNASGITSMVLPANVDTICPQAFNNCPLTSITSLNTTPPKLGANSFQNIPATCQVSVPSGAETAYGSAWSFLSTLPTPTSIPTYTVTFNPNGGAPYTPVVRTVARGAKLIQPTGITKQNNALVAWNKGNTADAWNFAVDTVKEDITLKAQWVRTFDITFNSNGGAPTPAPQTVVHSDKVVRPTAPTRKGYTFDTWNKGTMPYDFINTQVTAGFQLKAIWNIVQYNIISTVGAHGSMTAGGSFNYGTKKVFTVTPATNYVLDTLYVDGNDSTAAVTNNKYTLLIDTAHTIHAVFKKKLVTVTFEANGGTTPTSQTVSHGDKINEPISDSIGYSVVSWHKTTNTKSTTNIWNFSIDTVTKDIKLYANWKKNEYTVQYDYNNGRIDTVPSVLHGAMLTEPATPDSTGYTFGGWYAGTNPWTFSTTTVTSDTTLYAKWDIIHYRIVTFRGTGVTEFKDTVVLGNPVSKPTDPIRNSYALADWCTTNGTPPTNPWNFSNPVTVNTILYAKWIRTYRVTFNVHNGFSTPQPQDLKTGDTVSVPIAPTRIGYDFVGWYKEAAGTTAWNFSTDTVATAAITIHAVWNIKKYTITATTDGNGTFNQSSTVTKDSNTNISYVATADPHHVVDTIYVDGVDVRNLLINGRRYDFTNIDANHTIHAVFKLQELSVVFLSGPATSADTIDKQLVPWNTTATEPITDSTGYHVLSWHKQANLATANMVDLGSTPITANIRFFAKWEKNKYTVTFDANGGTAVSPDTITHGVVVPEPLVPPRPGYAFLGWFTDNTTFLNKWDFSTDTVTSNITLYANWKTAWTVAFIDHNRGTDLDTVIWIGGKITQPANPDSTGYTFVKWCKVGTTTAYNFNAVVTTNLTLYATWKINQYTLTASTGTGGNISPKTKKVNHGTDFAFTITPQAAYVLDTLLVDGIDSLASHPLASNYTFYNIDTAHTIHVGFKKKTFTLTAVAGANGSISPSGPTMVEYGSSQIFTFAPDPYYVIDSVKVDGVSRPGAVLSKSLTLSNIKDNHTIRVVFRSNKQNLAWAVPLWNTAYGDTTVLRVTSLSGARAVFSSGRPAVAQLVRDSLLIVRSNVDTAVIRAIVPADAFYAADTIYYTLRVSKKDRTIAFDPESVVLAYFNPFSFRHVPTGGAVTDDLRYKIIDAAGDASVTIDSVTGEVHAVSQLGTLEIQAVKLADNYYNAATASYVLEITQATQTINWNPNTNVAYGDTILLVGADTAIATSGLKVTFESLEANKATVRGDTLFISNLLSLPTTVTIRAKQISSSNLFANATPVERIFSIRGKQGLDWTQTLSDTTYGDTTVLNAAVSSTQPIVYTSSNPTVAEITGNVLRMKSGTGTAKITAAVAATADYIADTITQTVTAAKATLSVTADSAYRIYGDPNPSFTLSYFGWKNGEGTASLLAVPTATTVLTQAQAVGLYTDTIIPAGGLSNNYAFDYHKGNLLIDSATLTFKARDTTITYGQGPLMTSVTSGVDASGYKNGENISCLTSPLSLDVPSDTLAGTYPINFTSGASAANYRLVYIPGTLTINKAPLHVTVAGATITYGDPIPSFTVNYSGFVHSDTVANITPPTATTAASASSSAGKYPITLAGGASSNYDFTYINDTLTINKAPLTVTPIDTFKMYNTENPPIRLTYSGFKLADTPASLTPAPTATSTAGKSSAPGNYPITVAGGVSNNYVFTYDTATLRVDTATQSISFAEAVVDTFYSPTFSYTPTLIDDGVGSGAITYAQIGGSGTATLDTTSGKITDVTKSDTIRVRATKAGDGSYKAATAVYSLVIKKAPQTIIWNQSPTTFQNKKYGDAPIKLTGRAQSNGVNTNLPLTYTSTADTIVATSHDTAFIRGAGGPVTLTAVQAGNDNYLAVSSGVKTFPSVGKALLTVSAVDTTITSGDPIPTFRVRYSGWVRSSDDSLNIGSVISTPPLASTTVASGSAAGIYTDTIKVSGGVSSKYDFDYRPGTLTISKMAQSLTWGGTFYPTYGATTILRASSNSGNPVVFTASGGARIENDTLLIITSGTGSATVHATVDSTATHHSVDSVRTFAVFPATLTVAVADTFRMYGDPNPAFRLIYSGWKNGDSVSMITPPTPTTIATDTSSVGKYRVTTTGGSSENYLFSHTSFDSLEILKAQQTITWNLAASYAFSRNDTLTLAATSSSGDTVIYYSLDLGIAVVSGNTVLIKDTIGIVRIMALSYGNNNYHPVADTGSWVVSDSAKNVKGSVWVNDSIVLNPAAPYLVSCDASSALIEVRTENPSAQVTFINSPLLTSPGIYTIRYTVTTSRATRVDSVTVELRYQFSEVTSTLFDEVLIGVNVKNGYTFTGYTWYQNGSNAGTSQFYSATFDTTAVYSVDLTTTSGEVLHSCPGKLLVATRAVATSLQAYPNPVSRGGQVTVTGIPSDVQTLQVFDLSGRLVSTESVVEQQQVLSMPWADGLYFIKVGRKVVKILVE